MTKGPKIALYTVGGAVATAAGYYWWTHRKPTSTSTTPTSSSTPTSTTPTNTSTTPTSSSSSSSSGSGARYLQGQHANAQGQSVALQAAGSAVAGSSLIARALPGGFSQPVYQFWVHPPSSALSYYSGHVIQNGWVSWAGYTQHRTAVIPTPVAGTYLVAVYAREANAPTHESTSQRATYEASSGTYQVTVS